MTKIKAVFHRMDEENERYTHKITHVPRVGDRVSGYFVHRDAVWFIVRHVEWLKNYVYLYVEYVPKHNL